MARWRQPWCSSPIAEGVGTATGAAAATAAGADVRAGAGNTAGAGVQAKNGDNTKAVATTMVPECTGRRGWWGRRADTTLDISYPSARNPLTS